MTLSAQELAIAKSILVANNVIPATASDGDVSAAHQAMLESPNATAYRAQLEAGGVAVAPKPNWITILGLVGGAVAIYFIWQNSRKPRKVSSMEYPEPEAPEARMRRIGRALGSFSSGLGRSRCAPRRRLGAPAFRTKYQFEPEIRLEGHRSRKRR